MTSTRFLSRKDHRSNKSAEGEDFRCVRGGDISPGEQRPPTNVVEEADVDEDRSEETVVDVGRVRL
jgi:hypothetical protein